jgi:hypothetical protein
MSKLMPQGSYRWCPTPSCAHRWYTALPVACTCPKCGAGVGDASDGWPHVCTQGHAEQRGGDCGQCRTDKADKVRRKQERTA